MSKNIIIIGASGHAKVIIDIIEQLEDYTIVGLIDSFKPKGSFIFQYEILGNEKDIPALSQTYDFYAGIIAIGDNWTRKNIYKKIIKIVPEFEFISAIHPKSIIGKGVKIGKGTVIMAGAIVNSDAKIEDFCIINTGALLEHDCNLGKFASLAPNATVGGNVKIGAFSAICLSANVIQDISIGIHSIIGAGALVNRKVGDYKMVYGIPGKVIKEIAKGEKYLYNADKYAKEKIESYPQIEVIDKKAPWDKLIQGIGSYDFYHTYDYHMLSKKPDETPVLVVYKKVGALIAIPLLLRDIPGTVYKDATSVYGYPGPITKKIEADFNNSNFIKSLKNYFIENNIISVFSRLNPFMAHQHLVLKNFGDVSLQGQVVNIDLDLKLEKQRALYASRLKTHVNKARRLCTIRKAETPAEIQAYIDIYYENMDRVQAKKDYYFSSAYFEDILKSKDFRTEVLLAIDNESGTIIAGSMFIMTHTIVQYHLSGTKEAFLHVMPTKLLIDEMRIIATQEGYKFFNLGGGLGGKDDDSLFDFKASFSKDFKPFYLWKLIVNEAVYNELVSKKNSPIASDFFPLYRAENHLNTDS
ncbi:acetyltransferase [Mariniflexile ostreae]|uniref:Acetyltransferase n=1 Tax=Mariniflexile ostreae TaxID=1520892 RepID=A0ABV5FE09_9FLAO